MSQVGSYGSCVRCYRDAAKVTYMRGFCVAVRLRQGNARSLRTQDGKRSRFLRLFEVTIASHSEELMAIFITFFMSLVKNYSLGLILIIIISYCIYGCSNDKKNDNRKESETATIVDSLKQANDDLMLFVDGISSAIDNIAIQEGMLKTVINPESLKTSSKSEILNGLNYLQSVIKNQKENIISLQSKIKNNESVYAKKIQTIITSYTSQLEEKENKIAELEQQIKTKDLNIQSLKENVAALSENVNVMSVSIKEQKEVIENQSNVINEAYVVTGTKKELQKWGVLTKSGLFKKAKLNLSNINADNFTKVDIRTFTELPITGKNPKILSQMPPESYSLGKNNGNEYTLTILNPQLFWSISNFLIIQYN